MAEGEGFEPPEPLRVQWFSRPPPSTTRPSLRTATFGLPILQRPRRWISTRRLANRHYSGCESIGVDKGQVVQRHWPDMRLRVSAGIGRRSTRLRLPWRCSVPARARPRPRTPRRSMSSITSLARRTPGPDSARPIITSIRISNPIAPAGRSHTLGWSYECWRWDDDYVYHAVDHAIDGARRWEFYVFSDGRWMPRRLRKGETWTLELVDNRLTWYDAQCNPLPQQAAPYPRPPLARGIGRRRRRSGAPRRHRARVPAESGARRARNRGALLLREGRRLVSLDSGIGRCPVQPVRRRRAAADAALRARLPAVTAGGPKTQCRN